MKCLQNLPPIINMLNVLQFLEIVRHTKFEKMGCRESKQTLNGKIAYDLAEETGFTIPQLQRLYDRFLSLGAETKGLSEDQKPHLASADLLKLSQLAENPLAERIILSMYKERLPDDYYNLDVEVDEGILARLPFDQIQIPFDSFAKAFAR